MTALLRTVGIPEVSDCLIKRFKRLELNAVLVLIVLTDIHQIMGKLLIIFRTQVVLAAVSITTDATTVGHVVGTRITESLEHGIGPLLAYLEHNLALSCITVPVVLVTAEILKSLHLGTQTLAVAHVMLGTMTVLWVVATTYIIAEVTVVKPCGADQPVDNLANLLVRPLATLPCPPAERHAPTIEMLAHQLRMNHILEGIGRRHGVDFLAKVPQVLHVCPVLVGIYFLVSIIAVGAQILVVGFAAQLHILAHGLFNSPLSLIGRCVGNEFGVPLARK